MQGKLPLYLPATEIRIGRSDSSVSQDLELNGLGIAREHAVIRVPKGKTSECRALESFPGATTYINGRPVIPSV